MSYGRCVNTTGDARRDGHAERLPSATAPLECDQAPSRLTFAGIVSAKPKLTQTSSWKS
jgi:hypothetical protein